MLKVYTPRHQPDEVWVAIRCPKRNMMRRLSLFLGPLAMYWCLWNLRLTALYTTLPLSAQQQERMASGMESTTDSRRTASQHAATKATTEVDNTKPVLSTRNVLRMTELADRTQRTFFNQDDYRNVTNCPSHLAEDDVQVTLVTQLSTHRLWLAKEICTRWTQAPIVMLVYFPDEELFANISAPFREEIAAACPQVNLLYAVNDDANQTLYPINLLRNLALEAAQTSHVLLADADFLPSSELSDEIQTALGVRQQARQHLQIPKDDLDALVVPAFEFQFQWKSRQQAFLKDPAELSHLIPRSFQTLKECVNSTSCTVFHEKHYPSGHRSTRTHEWLREEWYETLDKESTPEETSFRDIRHVRCMDSPFWEPYLVLRWCPSGEAAPQKRVAPLYDERFVGYGMNKNQYIEHVRHLNYDFLIVPRGFLIHAPHSFSTERLAWDRNTDWLRRDMKNVYMKFRDDVHKSMGHVVKLMKCEYYEKMIQAKSQLGQEQNEQSQGNSRQR